MNAETRKEQLERLCGAFGPDRVYDEIWVWGAVPGDDDADFDVMLERSERPTWAGLRGEVINRTLITIQPEMIDNGVERLLKRHGRSETLDLEVVVRGLVEQVGVASAADHLLELGDSFDDLFGAPECEIEEGASPSGWTARPITLEDLMERLAAPNDGHVASLKFVVLDGLPAPAEVADLAGMLRKQGAPVFGLGQTTVALANVGKVEECTNAIDEFRLAAVKLKSMGFPSKRWLSPAGRALVE